jgi:TRAP-type C4-dicarboxylate transport system permease small subunit
MFTRAAKHMNKWLSYPSNLLSGAAMVALVFGMLAVVADVLMRWLFHSPIKGTTDLVTLSYSIIVWGPMAMAAFKGSHIALTFVVERIPRLPQLVLELIINLLSAGILGMVSWRLVVHGIRLGDTLQRTGVLGIPYEPFVYVGAFGCAIMALVFLARVPETVGKIRKEQ